MPYSQLKFLALIALITGCTTIVQTNPARTATEQLVISSAAERAAAKLAIHFPPGANIFIDTTNFEGTDSKYAIATIRSHLLQKGMHFVDDKKKADIIVEASAGALSTDRKTFLIGVPQFNIPIPLSPAPLPFPELAIYGSDDQKGVAKFAIDGYEVKKGTLVDAQDPQYGFSHNTKKTLLFFITWTDSDYLPDDVESESKKLNTANPKAHLEYNGNGYAPSLGASSTPSVAAQTSR